MKRERPLEADEAGPASPPAKKRATSEFYQPILFGEQQAQAPTLTTFLQQLPLGFTQEDLKTALTCSKILSNVAEHFRMIQLYQHFYR